ncbi:MAG TPA: hypothetical protein DD708_04025 [Deltaproteobacteria bacterium]|nr:hypothetical protein [Deltaproteobacteria bacterium]
MKFNKKIFLYFFLTTITLVLAILLIKHAVNESGDFKTYLNAALNFIHGHSIYDRNDYLPFVYLPIWALFFVPWALLGTSLACILWCLMNCALLYGSILLLSKQFHLNPFKDKKLFIPLVFLFYPIAKTFLNGQINILLVFGLILAVHFFHRKILSAFFFSLFISAKVSPLLLLPYFILKKQFRLCFAIVGWLIFYILFPTLFIGWEKNIESLKQYVSLVTHHPHLLSPHNHSITGILMRHFQNAFPHYQSILFLGTAILFGFIILFSCRKSIENAIENLWYELSIVLLSMFFITPIVWEHHLIILLPTLFLIFIYRDSITIGWKISLLATWVLFAFSSKTFVGQTISRNILFDHGVVLWWLGTLLAFLLFSSLREKKYLRLGGVEPPS